MTFSRFERHTALVLHTTAWPRHDQAARGPLPTPPLSRAAEVWLEMDRTQRGSARALHALAEDLRALHAPSILVRHATQAGARAHDGAVRTLRVANGIARARLSLGPDDVPVVRTIDLQTLATGAAVDHALLATVERAETAARLEVVTDQALHAALAARVHREAAHAGLGWDVTTWAMERGGLDVALAVDAAVAACLELLLDSEPAWEPVAPSQGLCGAEALTRARRDVPCDALGAPLLP